MSFFLVTFLLAACGNGDGTVTVTCAFDYTFPDHHEEGEWPGFSGTCDDWAESGEQVLASTVADCEADGTADGATTSICTCVVDEGTCTFAGGVND